RNDAGQLGYGNTTNLGDNEPVNNLPNVSLTGTVRKVVAGENHTCALTFAGTLRCWGRGDSGQLGQSFGGGDLFWSDTAGELPSNLPGNIDTGAPITDVAAGGDHTCALSSNGLLKCWGRGDSGQLGYGNFASQSTPPATGLNLDGATAYRITTGAAHTCALRSGGTARCWGVGADGRLGRGSTANSASATGKTDIQIFAPPQTCGNGTLDPGEQCDDGNTANDAVCDDNCTAPGCGNGILDPGEQCDDGNSLSGDGCENNCTVSHSVGGSVSGLGSGQSVVLRYNGVNDLTVTANGGFTFTTQVPSGSPYVITVLTNPSGMTCTVTNGSGTVAASNITNVAVTCTINVFTVGGTVSGLAAGDSITLLDNAGDNLIRSANGSFTFATPVAIGQPYAVTVVSPTSPVSQTCTVTSGSGTVGSGNITSVQVVCTNVRTVGFWAFTADTCSAPSAPNNGGCPGGTSAIGQPCSPIGARCFAQSLTICNLGGGNFPPLFFNAICQ
ncbi:MAG TPA: DUF4215 domain-containing protein, partial [Kofleriaceae bacterium]